MTTNRAILLCLLVGAAGCLQQPDADDLDAAYAQAGLTRSDYTDQDPWIVGISAGGKQCSAAVLSSHWILTAAHCAQVAPSSSIDVYLAQLPTSPGGSVPVRHLYDGSAQYFPNPDYHTTCPLGVCVDTDADDDIGLIHLTGGGINLANTGQAPLYDDEEEPYHGTGDRAFHIVGYGLGTDPGGSDDCSDGVARGKRIGYGFVVDVSGDDYQAHAPYGSTHPCPGDSGGPWLFARGDAGAKLDLVFGVMSSMSPDVPLFGDKMWSALVKPRRGWIEQVAAGTSDPLHCDAHAVSSWSYRRCDEPRLRFPPIVPNPPVAVEDGWQ